MLRRPLATGSATHTRPKWPPSRLIRGRPLRTATIARAHAHLGEVDAARAALAEGLEVAQRLDASPVLELPARGFCFLASHDAHETLARLTEQRPPLLCLPANLRFHPDLVEAAIEVGDWAHALRERAEPALRPRSFWACAIDARCEGPGRGRRDPKAHCLLERARVEHERLPSGLSADARFSSRNRPETAQTERARDAIATALSRYQTRRARPRPRASRRESAAANRPARPNSPKRNRVSPHSSRRVMQTSRSRRNCT